MKARACTKCRQWKARCDGPGVRSGEPGGGGSCSRCRALNLSCVFDPSFRRTSKAKHIQQMSTEIQQLRQALMDPTVISATSPNTTGPDFAPTSCEDGSDNGNVPNRHGENTRDEAVTAFDADWEPQLALPLPQEPDTHHDPAVSMYLPTEVVLLPQQTTSPVARDGSSVVSSAPSYRVLGNIGLTFCQVGECFKAYFARCHQHLPFKMKTHSHEEIYAECPLLFWVICAVTSSWDLRILFAPIIKAMVAETIHSRHRSIETIQTFLILCTWPFPISSLREDPSHLYSGIAIQMGLQLGLHCPSQAHTSHFYGREGHIPGHSEVKLTTWLACFVVNQMQSNHIGLPPTMPTAPHLSKAFDYPAIDPNLSRLCHVAELLTQSTMAISTTGSSDSGMITPDERLGAIQRWAERFAALEERLGQMNDVVGVSFLTARLQLWSFGLLDDMPLSTDLFQIIKKAEEDSCHLIDLCYDRNLNVSPYSFVRAMCHSGLVLVKILRLSRTTQVEVLEDKISHVRQALGSTVTSPDDMLHKVCQRLKELPHLEDKKLSPPVMSRMGLSMMYDLLRIFMENKSEGLVQEAQPFVLDGFDWTFGSCSYI